MFMGYFCFENLGKHSPGLFQQFHELMALSNTIRSSCNKFVMYQICCTVLRVTVTSDMLSIPQMMSEHG